MTPSEQLQRRVDQCRERWEPFIEDSMGVTYGGYRHHDEHCLVCPPIIAVLRELTEARQKLYGNRQQEIQTVSGIIFGTSQVGGKVYCNRCGSVTAAMETEKA